MVGKLNTVLCSQLLLLPDILSSPHSLLPQIIPTLVAVQSLFQADVNNLGGLAYTITFGYVELAEILRQLKLSQNSPFALGRKLLSPVASSCWGN